MRALPQKTLTKLNSCIKNQTEVEEREDYKKMFNCVYIIQGLIIQKKVTNEDSTERATRTEGRLEYTVIQNSKKLKGSALK